MESKFFEIRDAATFIPALAVQISREDGYLARRAGFGDALVYLIHLEGQKCAYDHFEWNNQTMHVAHEYIDMNWAKLEDGDVVDVQFILGETPEPKKSERETV